MNLRIYLFLPLLMSSLMLFAQRKPRIKGSRVVTEVSQNLPPFNAVKLVDDLEITLKEAADPGFDITADDNLVDVLKFDVQSDTLFISSFYNITAKRKLEIRVRYNELRSVDVRDGRLQAENIINSEYLRIKTSGDSRLELDARTQLVEVHMAGQSTGQLNLESDSVQVALRERADLKLYQVSQNLKVHMDGNSDADMDGSAGMMAIDLSDGAELRASRVDADTVIINSSGAAKSHIRARELELTSSGSANTYLYGDAGINILEFTDTSELYKRRD